MVFKTTFTFVAIAALALFTQAPQANAHSWVDCVDWRFNDKSSQKAGIDATKNKQKWDDNSGTCHGYARRYPIGKKFASLDSADPNRHYQQTHKNPKPDAALACSDGRHGEESGSDETRAKPESKAYAGKDGNKKWGVMTVAKKGQLLCVRWPAKNHAVKDERENHVRIYMPTTPGKEYTNQKDLLNNKEFLVATLPYKNCNTGGSQDKRPCGGCFNVPGNRAPGIYQMQWRWELNPNEFYTSCADIQVTN
ncbi:hypothetical protein BGZ83_006783 [Gryganskiella cystojenkinii]|nr:hypothetical protein BGZ83_006783 [Gryganskiella cystojenkinii]